MGETRKVATRLRVWVDGVTGEVILRLDGRVPVGRSWVDYGLIEVNARKERPGEASTFSFQPGDQKAEIDPQTKLARDTLKRVLESVTSAFPKALRNTEVWDLHSLYRRELDDIRVRIVNNVPRKDREFLMQRLADVRTKMVREYLKALERVTQKTVLPPISCFIPSIHVGSFVKD